MSASPRIAPPQHEVGFGVTLAVALLVGFPLSVLRGWVLTILWRWHVVPVTGFAPLGVWPAVGLMAAATLFMYLKPDEERPTAVRLVAAAMVSLFAIGMALLVGWIAEVA
jgi:hypothetical protein